MSLKIIKLQKEGDAKKEYLLLQATEDINLRDYAIADYTFDKDGKPSNIHRHFFRFPNLMMKKGDFVALFTSKGSYKLGQTESKKPCHFIYFGSDAPVWNDAETEHVEVFFLKIVDQAVVNNKAPEKSPTRPVTAGFKNPYSK
jgi:hypothetical protein